MNDILKKAIAEAEWYVSQYPSHREDPKAAQADNELTIANLTMWKVMAQAGIDEETIATIRKMWIKAGVTGESAAAASILRKHYTDHH